MEENREQGEQVNQLNLHFRWLNSPQSFFVCLSPEQQAGCDHWLLCLPGMQSSPLHTSVSQLVGKLNIFHL